ncbi:MAG: CPBP family intramembrane glutamic endopeptidase [Desulfobaccales bacterium]
MNLTPEVMHLRTTSAPDWKTSPWPYFILAFGWSWLFWIPLVLTGMDISVTPGIVLLAMGVLGPAVSAIFLTCLTGDKQERRDYWSRLISCKRIGPRWYAIIILIAPVYSVLAILTGLVIKGNIPAFDTAVGYVTHPLTIIPFAIMRLVYGPLPEELGWRGYALDRLQRKWNALVSSLVLGVIWAVWHTPMFFIRGSLMSEVFPLWSTKFWVAMGPGILAGAVVMTWIYNNTQRSTLAAILFHFMMNFTGEFLRLPGDIKTYQFVWLTIIAIVVTLVYGPATLKGKVRRRLVGMGRESG